MTIWPPPERIAIDHDDYHAKHIGHTSDGRQFFLTTPFRPGFGGDAGEEFVALYLFDPDGQLLEARIDTFGPRGTMDLAARTATYEQRLRELGDVTYDRIEIAPFTVERFGTAFGLIPRDDEDDEDDEDGDIDWYVELHPGNYMAFAPPWDSGEYDT
ncbi:hypothetical protein ACQP00_18580 [Dactylosporangium sp. CS-047395]|uniref:hypothetical protein n=1 Tax=Dactylosporangium sp. CS-047395 TaxID=3239936 RepID=UPI003D8FB54C